MYLNKAEAQIQKPHCNTLRCGGPDAVSAGRNAPESWLAYMVVTNGKVHQSPVKQDKQTHFHSCVYKLGQ